MENFEKLGKFYLGRTVDVPTKKTTDNLFLYDSKDLTTHAVCVGMTGSGKTGLGITLLEEAAIDKIPAIVLDPKGDLGNLLLTFPKLSPSDFQPWVDQAEAERKGETAEEYASNLAKTWKEGLAKWGETPARIQKLRDSVEMVIYTPANRAGIPLSILSSFDAPPKDKLLDTGAIRERISSITSSLLGLLGIQADPIKSREHILISSIMEKSWNEGENLDLVTLIQKVQKPPFEKIGALDIDTFYPLKERMALSISLNGLLASPGFQAWMEGSPLDIKQLLYTDEGKPKLSIISIAHLNDSERMFFVTLFLNQLIVWMRSQPGTSSLRALLYMDEIFGYFPPSSMPPSKLPMLTLLKQARAFGLGIVLATQNPVDLDYKGLSNCGTWFIGKLQTERDKARIIEGLTAASNGEINNKIIDKLLGVTGTRIFIMQSIHTKEPLAFETRWTMSFLRGPLTLSQIQILTDKRGRPAIEDSVLNKTASPKSKTNLRPTIPPGIDEFFLRRPNSQAPAHYRPFIAGFAKVHFVDNKHRIDVWKNIALVATSDEAGKTVDWEKGEDVPEIKQSLVKDPIDGSSFEELPSGLMQEKNYNTFSKEFAANLYQNQTLSIYEYADLKLLSQDEESEGDFRSRVAIALREERDKQVKKIEDEYSSKITTLTERLRKSQEKIIQKQQQMGWKKVEAFLSIFTTILGAFFGKKITKGTISQAGTTIKRAGKISQETQQVTHSEDNSRALQQQLEDIQTQMNHEIEQIPSNVDPSSLKLETIEVKPRKTDTSIEKIALVWIP